MSLGKMWCAILILSKLSSNNTLPTELQASLIPVEPTEKAKTSIIVTPITILYIYTDCLCNGCYMEYTCLKT